MDYDNGPDNNSLLDTKRMLPLEELDTEFKRKYPPDLLGKEIEDGARVWKVFRDEATAYDKSMLDSWNKTLDILLIFAGLFSAVATAFIIESYKLLQPDNSADYTATALYALVLATNNSAALRLLPLPPSPSTQVSSASLWINGLWFSSLFLSLAVSLLCILVKQWVGEYTARTTASATNRHWARRRMFYLNGLKAWHLSGFMSFLPLLLHLALFLFFGGLGTFLWSLDRGIGAIITAASVSLSLFYTASTAVPMWQPDCPSSTPLVNQVRKAIVAATMVAIRSCIVVLSQLAWLTRMPHVHSQHNDRETDPEVAVPRSGSHSTHIVERLEDAITRLNDKSTLQAHLQSRRDDMDSAALHWLILSVSDSDPVAVGLQAIGALRPFSPLAAHMRSEDVLNAATFNRACTSTTASRSATEVARIVRSILCLRCDTLHDPDLRLGVPTSMMDVLHDTDYYPDTGLLWASVDIVALELQNIRQKANTWLPAASPSLTSSAILLVGCPGIQLQHALCILICVRLDELSGADWEYIFAAVERASGCVRPQHTHKECGCLCLADYLVSMIHRPDGAQLDRDDIEVAKLLVLHVLSVNRDSRLQLVDLPCLFDFMASNQCLSYDYSASALGQLARSLSRPEEWLLRDCTIWLSINRVISNILHIAVQREWTDPDLPKEVTRVTAIAYRHWLSTYSEGYPALGLPTGGDVAGRFIPLEMLLQVILHKSDTRTSNWEIICYLDCATSLKLADSLAAAVCSLSRKDKDTSALTDLVFAPVQSLEISRFIHGEAKKYGMDDFLVRHLLHLAQHSLELRSTWWRGLQQAVVSDGDEDLTKFTDLLAALVSKRGPCLSCPGLPIGWVVDTARSVCSFDPSS